MKRYEKLKRFKSFSSRILNILSMIVCSFKINFSKIPLQHFCLSIRLKIWKIIITMYSKIKYYIRRKNNLCNINLSFISSFSRRVLCYIFRLRIYGNIILFQVNICIRSILKMKSFISHIFISANHLFPFKLSKREKINNYLIDILSDNVSLYHLIFSSFLWFLYFAAVIFL